MSMTDESMMPFGKYKGRQLADVPAEYLYWLYDNNKCYGQLKWYIFDNLEVIKAQMEREMKKQNKP